MEFGLQRNHLLGQHRRGGIAIGDKTRLYFIQLSRRGETATGIPTACEKPKGICSNF
jgi:hypothetical protein